MLDDLERALEAAERARGGEARGGRRLVHRALVDALTKEGLDEIETDGAFDPHVHEALLSQPSDEEEGTMIEVLQKGYRLGDRVLRPARVIVGRRSLTRRSTRPSASRRTRRRTRSRRRTASSRAQYHPDKNPGDEAAEERFKEVQARVRRALRPREAQAVRRVRRRTRARPGGPGGGRSTSTSATSATSATSSAGSSAAAAAAARAAARSAASAAPTSRRDVNLSFEDSLKGVETQIPVELETACRECGRHGREAGHGAAICPECNGRGVVSETQGLFALSQPCPRCRGNGTVIEEPCPNCQRHAAASGARSATR